MSDICQACNGKGWVPNPNVDIKDPNSPDHIDCASCGGDGWTN